MSIMFLEAFMFRYRRTILAVALWLVALGCGAAVYAQEAEGKVVVSDRTLFSLGSVVMIVGVVSAALALKADVRSFREALAAHAADKDAHHGGIELRKEFVPRGEHEACHGEVLRALARIENKLGTDK